MANKVVPYYSGRKTNIDSLDGYYGTSLDGFFSSLRDKVRSVGSSIDKLRRDVHNKITPDFVKRVEDRIKKNEQLMNALNAVGCAFLSIIPGVGLVLAAAANAAFKAYMARRGIHDAVLQQRAWLKTQAELQRKYDSLSDQEKAVINASVEKYGDAAFERPEVKKILDGKFAEVVADLEKDILQSAGYSSSTQNLSANTIGQDAQNALSQGVNISPFGEINMVYVKYGALVVVGIAVINALRRP